MPAKQGAGATVVGREVHEHRLHVGRWTLEEDRLGPPVDQVRIDAVRVAEGGPGEDVVSDDHVGRDADRGEEERDCDAGAVLAGGAPDHRGKATWLQDGPGHVGELRPALIQHQPVCRREPDDGGGVILEERDAPIPDLGVRGERAGRRTQLVGPPEVDHGPQPEIQQGVLGRGRDDVERVRAEERAPPGAAPAGRRVPPDVAEVPRPGEPKVTAVDQAGHRLGAGDHGPTVPRRADRGAGARRGTGADAPRVAAPRRRWLAAAGRRSCVRPSCAASASGRATGGATRRDARLGS